MSPAAQVHLLATQRPFAPQLAPQAPQLSGSAVKSRHWPLQSVKPAGHRHLPPLHALPPAQLRPHAPQFSGSVFSLTQLRPHAAFGAVHVLTQSSL
jgi:hypothetical protein